MRVSSPCYFQGRDTHRQALWHVICALLLWQAAAEHEIASPDPQSGSPAVPLRQTVTDATPKVDVRADTQERHVVIIIGGGVAGSEAGTYLKRHSPVPLHVIEVESEPQRKFGGWGFQAFPATETTNLALRKMYLGDDPQDIHRWVSDAQERSSWPKEWRHRQFHPDRPIPRPLIQRYIRWRRQQPALPRGGGPTHTDATVQSGQQPDVVFQSVTGNAVHVGLLRHGPRRQVEVRLQDGRSLLGDRVILASGSISVKLPPFLLPFINHTRVIVDPLTVEGHQRRALIPRGASVLILGTGLTGEEQASVLLQSNHTDLTLFSRSGKRHFVYPEEQHNLPLQLLAPPAFFAANSTVEFDEQFSQFIARHLRKGHCHEDIFAALRKWWVHLRREMGGCRQAARQIYLFRRTLATRSIGAPSELAVRVGQAERQGHIRVARGLIHKLKLRSVGGKTKFAVHYGRSHMRPDNNEVEPTQVFPKTFDYIINAVGRNIIRHPLWQGMLREGLAKKHAGIGVQISADGQLIDGRGRPSDLLYVVGMARAGDHALRHGYLGNTAFNVPQVRAHLSATMEAFLRDVAGAPKVGKTQRRRSRFDRLLEAVHQCPVQ